jgi:hypothetical protein
MNSQVQSSVPENSKKTYFKPTFQAYGNLAQITLGSGTKHADSSCSNSNQGGTKVCPA